MSDETQTKPESTAGLLTDEPKPDQQQDENKPDDSSAAVKQDDNPKADDTPKDEGKVIPETYELKMQEGFSLAEGQQAEIDTLFKGMGLTQEQGQQLADYYMKNEAARQAQTLADYQKAQEAEIAAAKADTEIGGAALNENLGFARAAMDKFGGETFRRELEAHGMANNAEMIRLLARVGRAMQGDTLVTGQKGQQQKDAAHVLYPNLP